MTLTEKDKREIKEWTKALRSGKYKQTKDTLQDKNGYCCLGVACELFTELPIKTKNVLDGGLPNNQPHGKIWLNKINLNILLKFGRELTKLNDYDNYSFKEIADAIS